MAFIMEDYERLIKWGSCSWNYPAGWKGVVYHFEDYDRQLPLFSAAERIEPPAFTTAATVAQGYGAELLAQYCAFPPFSTLCFDMTHYRPFSAEELKEFDRFLAPNFPIMIKVWDQVTRIGNWKKSNGSNSQPLHVRLDNPDFMNASLFREKILPSFQEAFSDHVGMFVFEFMRLGYYDNTSKEWINYEARKFNRMLRRFLRGLPKGFRYAVELRDRNLVNREYAHILSDRGVAHCFNQWETMYSIQKQYEITGFTADFAAVRVLTPTNVKYAWVQKAYAPYDHIHQRLSEVRADLIRLITLALQRNVELFIAINNRAEGHAPGTVSELDATMRSILSIKDNRSAASSANGAARTEYVQRLI